MLHFVDEIVVRDATDHVVLGAPLAFDRATYNAALLAVIRSDLAGGASIVQDDRIGALLAAIDYFDNTQPGQPQ